jgi:hypothetical protein
MELPMGSSQDRIIKNYYDHKDTIMVNQLSEIVSDLYLAGTGDKADRLWERAASALVMTQVEPDLMSEVLKSRDVEALAILVGELTGKQPAAKTPPTPLPTPAPTASPATPASPTSPASKAVPSSDEPTPEELKGAMKAFRKRLKLARLDAESGLSRSPMSGGRGSGIVAIQPPNKFPKAVWNQLVENGRLEYAGSGMYQLPNP